MTESRRADATRNVERILEAATACLLVTPSATMTEIARAAGLGRVTLYGHFASRAELVEAVAGRVLGANEAALADLDQTGDARAALVRLLRATWRQLDAARAVLAAATQELSPERLWDLHKEPAARVERLVERGRREGVFRSDLPVSWLVAVVHQVVHGAAEEVAADRLDPDAAADVVVRTVLAVFAPPAEDPLPGIPEQAEMRGGARSAPGRE
ncbi:TetR/AcrR family transcriptional regulator [Pseudonocardia xishanensis]|uniref:HTH tetR-type domain-containing protein n=1 Tax=Pseudonocardia xishanensis TaxID=630995 RepID=A0ABP8RJ58_9PSEU